MVYLTSHGDSFPGEQMVRPVVIDNGTTIKVNDTLADSDDLDPKRISVSSILGILRPASSQAENPSPAKGDGGVGQNNPSPLHPIQNGVVTDWDAMEEIWKHIYDKELGVSSTQHPLLMTWTHSVRAPKTEQEKTTEIAFESLSVPSFYLASAPNLALYAHGRVTGVALLSGEHETSITPIYESCSFPHAVKAGPLGGQHLTDQLKHLLNQKGHLRAYPIEMHDTIARDIKEKVCCVSTPSSFYNYVEGRASHPTPRSYILPDGQKIMLRKERYAVPEVMFESGLAEAVQQSIRMAMGSYAVSDMYASVALAGGNTLFPGLAARLRRDLRALAPAQMPNVLSAEFGRDVVWVGGMIVGSLSTFEELAVTREEYEEFGVGIVQRRCIVP